MSFNKKTKSLLKDITKTLLLILPVEKRFPKIFWNTKIFLNKAQWWSKSNIQNWQFKKTKEIIEYAYNNVPGYNQLFRENNVIPLDYKELTDIIKFPTITKEIIRDNLKDFTSRKIPKYKLVYMTTGGSTGIPFGFYNTIKNYYIERAFIYTGWERTSWKLAERAAVMRGSFIGSEEKFYKYDRFNNELLLSSYYLNENTYHNYLSKILDFNPKHIQAYPSSAMLFSKYIIGNDDIGKINCKTLFLGSENLYDWQKKLIKKAFPESSIIHWYGHAEKVILADYCESNEQFHIWPFYGLTEILDKNGKEVSQNETGELVGTSFWNYATPFIRYRTKDFAKKGEEYCKNCKRQFKLIEQIDGRLQEFIISSNGRFISMTSINMHDDIFDKIKQFQFYQDTPGLVTFKYIPKITFSNDDGIDIYNRIKLKLVNDFELNIMEVENIEIKKSGKYSFLEQKLKLEFGD